MYIKAKNTTRVTKSTLFFQNSSLSILLVYYSPQLNIDLAKYVAPIVPKPLKFSSRIASQL